MTRLAQWATAPLRVWRASLPFRVLATTVAGSIVILVLAGLVLMRQAADGIVNGKRQAAVVEASTALATMQQQLRNTDLQTSSLYERINQLANEAGGTPSQFRIVIQGPVSGYVSPDITARSVPDSLARTVEVSDGMFVTPTTVDYRDPETPDEPGLAVGTTLQGPGVSARYPIYFIFPESHEVQTLAVLRRAVLTTGIGMVVGVSAVAWLVARQVVRPVRRASATAERLASGHLTERMPVEGTDDLAVLGRSMNHMAAEIEQQIGQLEDLSRVQRQFVSDVSHELRTPLTTVKMAADLLYDQRDEMDPIGARSTEIMHDELDRFDALLSDLLEISRFDAGAAVLALEEQPLADVVVQEVEAQRPFATRLETELTCEVRGDTTAEIDARRVQRIIRNLLTNAIEHGEGRPIVITVAGDDEAVAVTVRDHGVGFRADQARLVFHRFWRADPSRNRMVGGSGLGLAISMEDTLLHHGWLSAWGRPGQGAQFRLTLPRNPSVVLHKSPLPLSPVDTYPVHARSVQ